MAQTDAVPQPEAVLPVIGDVAQPADDNGAEANPPSLPALDAPLPPRKGSRISRSVIPGLPRAQTFKRQLSEHRDRLRPIQPTGDERRAMSVDRRTRAFDAYPERVNPDEAIAVTSTVPPTDQPRQQQEQEPQETTDEPRIKEQQQQDPVEQTEAAFPGDDLGAGAAAKFLDVSPDEPNDAASIASAQEEFDAMIRRELETTWILNLSMRYKDQSNREKFFVSYRAGGIWRRVTVTVDYRDVPRDSLEMELLYMRYQRDKNARIYEDIRSSLQEIRFYETVTNLRLETRDDRLHVHVVEDANEIISFPPVSQVAHIPCPRIRESDIVFDHHMSGFVYKVKVGGQGLIKKEIPGPDTIDEFMYEINALSSLVDSDSVIDFYGLVVDDQDLHVKGLLIKYADGGALVDILYDHCKDRQVGLQWWLRKRWARQIVQGLADIHDAGFVQGDFTLSNIVIDEHDDAKIIDINRRGCPVGWEPPEATPLVESHYSITMYIGVKSDLFQLGMVLWALAMGEDEPEREGRPLTFGSDSGVPQWYQDMTNICLSPDPRKRREASRLLDFFPSDEELLQPHIEAPLAPPKLRVSVETDDHDTSADIDDDISSVPGYAYLDDDDDQDSKDRDDDDDDINDAYEIPRGRLAQSYNWWREGSLCLPASAGAIPPWHYAPRGRSPPSPLPSDDEDDDDEDGGPSKRRRHSYPAWAANRNIRPSYSDAGDNDNEIPRFDQRAQQLTPSTSKDMGPFLGGLDPEDASLDLEAAKAEITVEEEDDQDEAGPEANAVTDTAIPEEPTQENVAEGKGEDIQVPAENELQAEDVPAENKDEQSPAYPEKLEAEGHPVVEKGESDPVGSQEEPPAEAKADEATVEPETDEGHTDSKAEDTVESKAEEVSTEISTETAPPAPDSQQTQQDKTEPPADAAVPPPDNDGTSGATAEGSQATGSTIDGQDGPAEKTPGTEASSTDNNGDENSNSNTNTESPGDAAPQEPETASNGLGDLQVAPSDESNSNHHSVERVEPEQEQEQKHAEDQHEHAPDAEAEAEVGHANESSWDYSTGVAAGASAHDDATPRAPPSPPATGAASNPHQDAEGKGIEGLDHSLAGVGTMHMSINCDLLEKRGIDDDFQLIGRSEVATL